MKVNRVLAEIAIKNGVSVAEVRKEIQAALDEGMKNPDTKVQAYWNKIPHRSNKPTPEDVIAFMVKEAREKKNDSNLR